MINTEMDLFISQNGCNYADNPIFSFTIIGTESVKLNLNIERLNFDSL
jgi:hypothetical protein